MSTAEEFAVEISGTLHREDVTALVENLDPDTTIESVRIGIATSNPADLTIVQNGNTPHQTRATPEQAVRLQLDSDPFYIACAIHGEDEWLRSEDIRERLPEAWDVSEDALGTNLWSLADRGLIEKRPYEQDRRQKEYRITERGEAAIEEAFDRTDALEVADLDQDPAAVAEAL